jgi:hypothetical protein
MSRLIEIHLKRTNLSMFLTKSVISAVYLDMRLSVVRSKTISSYLKLLFGINAVSNSEAILAGLPPRGMEASINEAGAVIQTQPESWLSAGTHPGSPLVCLALVSRTWGPNWKHLCRIPVKRHEGCTVTSENTLTK